MRKFTVIVSIFIIVICMALTIARSNTKQTEGDRNSKLETLNLPDCITQSGSKLFHAQLNAELKIGKLLYNKYSCLSCHGPDGILQGNLTNAYKKFTGEQIKEYIKNANRFNNFKMPVYETIIPDADYQPLIAYVKWLGERARR